MLTPNAKVREEATNEKTGTKKLSKFKKEREEKGLNTQKGAKVLSIESLKIVDPTVYINDSADEDNIVQ